MKTSNYVKIDAYDFSEVCHAKKIICKFCSKKESKRCSECVVNEVVDYVHNSIKKHCRYTNT